MDDADRSALIELAQTHRNQTSEVLPSPYVRISNFLPDPERDVLFAEIVAAEPDYVSNAMDGRRAMVLTSPPSSAGLLIARILEAATRLIVPLGLDPDRLIAPTVSDLVVVASGHRDFFGPHRDDIAPLATAQTRARRVSITFHMNSSPKQFTGGELRLYDHRVLDGEPTPATTFVPIEPEDNTLIAFLSSTRHEVATVVFERNTFADRRFSINGSFSIPN